MLFSCGVILALVWPELTCLLHQFLGMMWELALAKTCSSALFKVTLRVRGLNCVNINFCVPGHLPRCAQSMSLHVVTPEPWLSTIQHLAFRF